MKKRLHNLLSVLIICLIMTCILLLLCGWLDGDAVVTIVREVAPVVFSVIAVAYLIFLTIAVLLLLAVILLLILLM